LNNDVKDVHVWKKSLWLQNHKWKQPWANVLKAIIASNNGSKQDKASNVWRSQRRLRFNFTWATLMLSCDIFIINVLYYARTHFKGSSIEIHWVSTFFKFLNPPISTIWTSLVNSKWHLGEPKKWAYMNWSKSSNLDTIGKFDKTCNIGFVLWAIQCYPIM
jgi:hypothetical protein